VTEGYGKTRVSIRSVEEGGECECVRVRQTIKLLMNSRKISSDKHSCFGGLGDTHLHCLCVSGEIHEVWVVILPPKVPHQKTQVR
jgi:hypothetical protein